MERRQNYSRKREAKMCIRDRPCPNLSTGGHNAHGRFEYIPVQSMDAMVRVLRLLTCEKTGKAD